MNTLPVATPLEDELGDVLEKAMRRSAIDADALALAAGVERARILDAIDYRSDLTAAELSRLASALRLNEVGLCALGAGCYPVPAIDGLPFQVWPLHMPHGVGVTNAYVISDGSPDGGVLFDTGSGISGLEAVWPKAIRQVAAVFLTHVEAEHAGGLCEIVDRFRSPPAYTPAAGALSQAAGRVERAGPCTIATGEGTVHNLGSLEVTVFSTPGHALAHNCYHIRSAAAPAGRSLLVCGDLIFAGSAGGGYFCHRQLATQLRRVLAAVPPSTALAPGHGPMTTVENELRFNPFL